MHLRATRACLRAVSRASLTWGGLVAAALLLLAGLLGAQDVPTAPSQHLRQDFILRTWNTDNGLPHPTARCLVEGADGFVWIGTFNGAARLESPLTASPFSLEQKTGLKTEACVSLLSDSEGRLWIGSDIGLVMRAGRRWQAFKPSEGSPWGVILGLAEAPDGTILFGTKRGLFQVSNSVVKPFPVPGGVAKQQSPWHPVRDASGALWVYNDLYLAMWKGNQWISMREELGIRDMISGVSAARGGGVWIGEPHRIRKVQDGRVLKTHLFPEDFRDSLQSILEDSQGRLWVGGSASDLVLFGADDSVNRVSRREGLVNSHVTALLETREGVIFIGFGGGGALQLTPRRVKMVQGYAPDLLESQISSVSSAHDGSIVFSTAGGKLNRIHAGVIRTEFDLGSRVDINTALIGQNGDAWIGTESGGLIRGRDGRILEELSTPQVGSKRIICLHEDAAGVLWVGTDRGFARRENGQFQIYGSQGHSDLGGVLVFAEKSPSKMYVASEEGLYLWEPKGLKTLVLSTNFPDRLISGMVCDPSDGVWFTLRNGGIGWRRDNDTDYFISEKQGAPRLTIGSLVDSEMGYLWGTTSLGLYRFGLGQLKGTALSTRASLTPLLVNQHFGLLSDNCRGSGYASSALGKDGRLWFASDQGLAVISPEQFVIRNLPPMVYFLHAAGQAGPIYPEQGVIALPPKTRHAFLRFTCSSLAAPETIFYEYRLVPSDKDWVPNGNSPVIQVSLPVPGKHTLQVRARNSDGAVDTQPAVVYLDVPITWTETLWFRLGLPLTALMGIVGLVIAAQRRHMHSLQKALREQEERRQMEETLRLVAQNTQACLAYLDFDLRPLWCNRAFVKLFSPDHTLSRSNSLRVLLSSAENAPILRHLDLALQGQTQRFEWTIESGKPQTQLISVIPHQNGPRTSGLFVSCVDVTQLKQSEQVQKDLEQQLLQSQKMEALGTLAGGIAHDFNNILTAITGNTQLAIMDLGEDHPVQLCLKEINLAAQRAAGLVRQILTFSRQEEQRKEVIRLQSVAVEAIHFLRVGLPANIEIETRFMSGSDAIHADPNQIHQIIVNLATNAIQAMKPHGGRLLFEESMLEVTTEPGRASHALAPGRYVCLKVIDTGMGMSRETMDRAFDPFFTTKPPNEGTGLGLAVVHGIVQRLGGSISIESQLGKGTTFELRFPATNSSPGSPLRPQPTAAELVMGQGQHVLLVDDDEALVHLTERVIIRLGYQVTSFTRPTKALHHFQNNPKKFAAVITDLSMPEMTGADLVRAIRRTHPRIPVILTTGFIRPEDQRAADDLEIHSLLLKPSSVDEMSKHLSQALHSIAPAPRP